MEDSLIHVLELDEHVFFFFLKVGVLISMCEIFFIIHLGQRGFRFVWFFFLLACAADPSVVRGRLSRWQGRSVSTQGNCVDGRRASTQGALHFPRSFRSASGRQHCDTLVRHVVEEIVERGVNFPLERCYHRTFEDTVDVFVHAAQEV